MSILSRGNLARYKPYKNNLLKIFIKSFLLGSILTINLTILLFFNTTNTNIFNNFKINLYLIFLDIFYSLEFINTIIFNNSQVDDDSFILEDKEIHYFTIFSILEYYFINWNYINLYIGLIMILIGQFIRSLSMYTANESFNHYIQRNNSNNKHKLITNGIYLILRHPSYFGFFVWFIGLEIFLNNLISLIIGGIILWNFFKQRIEFEEKFLIDFFGDDYINYRKRTKTWMMI